ncbi:MAG: bifunctional methylenetetrahydrofolate dehydrogenase/methenyltetrahydrofolate cyclohydrolase FolD [Denitrovibrio sp.]|nr:MAG: bifunctional methylenetetrahydrofolate dehydrogenase/methenyltetrahydrofolate cyclohydrolase FolD [Denitrovibrio sp.]
MATLLDGKALAQKVRAQLKTKVDKHKVTTGRVPGLAVVLVGEDPASQVYVRMKNKACEEAGYKSIVNRMPDSTTTEQLLAVVNEYNNDDSINGILVQLPLPDQINESEVLYAIKPEKDVDGFHPFNVGLMNIGADTLFPCTPYGCMKFFEEYGIDITGKSAVVIGRSNIVGKPMASLLIKANTTVTVCHSKTKDIASVCRQADIIVAAIGRAEYVTADFVKEGAVVIDVGMNRKEDGKLCGDVAFDEVYAKASYITPVPGGVGPMTIAMLLANTMKAFEAAL